MSMLNTWSLVSAGTSILAVGFSMLVTAVAIYGYTRHATRGWLCLLLYGCARVGLGLAQALVARHFTPSALGQVYMALSGLRLVNEALLAYALLLFIREFRATSDGPAA